MGDDGLPVLLNAVLLCVQSECGQTIDPKELERRITGKTMFKVESATVNTALRLLNRKLLQKVSVNAQPSKVGAFIP